MELAQCAVPGRKGMVGAFLLNCAGVAIAVLAI